MKLPNGYGTVYKLSGNRRRRGQRDDNAHDSWACKAGSHEGSLHAQEPCRPQKSN